MTKQYGVRWSEEFGIQFMDGRQMIQLVACSCSKKTRRAIGKTIVAILNTDRDIILNYSSSNFPAGELPSKSREPMIIVNNQSEEP
jgi:hypothetical protein